MKKILLALLATASVAVAAVPTVTVTWSAPSANTDGSTITGPITYQLYVGAKGAEVKYKTPVTSPPYVLVPTPPVGSQVCVQITATAGGVESDPSAEVCGTVPATKPNAPSNLVISVK